MNLIQLNFGTIEQKPRMKTLAAARALENSKFKILKFHERDKKRHALHLQHEQNELGQLKRKAQTQVQGGHIYTRELEVKALRREDSVGGGQGVVVFRLHFILYA